MFRVSSALPTSANQPAITKAGVEGDQLPVCDHRQNVGVVAVPMRRLVALRELYARGRGYRQSSTTVRFIDIAGLVRS